MSESYRVLTPDEFRAHARQFDVSGNGQAAHAYRHLAIAYERLNRSEEKLRGNLCDSIATDRGWHPLVVDEEMTVHFGDANSTEPRRKYLIKRMQ